MHSLSYDLESLSTPPRDDLELTMLRLWRILVNILDDIFDDFSYIFLICIYIYIYIFTFITKDFLLRVFAERAEGAVLCCRWTGCKGGGRSTLRVHRSIGVTAS